ncbi:hypothetical protein DOTSEDRAFT_73551 [Dothistroma septosporum NZE10]|uniref:Uncharacterized protein n=1 Tax=Dothistroma septosporum (strain NZE10 / CBS 128990) TaxID=675120 RepID=N1PIM3_DOTSN|nr:hypothetical protein DOTSEDRAFT_73551 [Dothistroma septosporum NZE10]
MTCLTEACSCKYHEPRYRGCSLRCYSVDISSHDILSLMYPLLFQTSGSMHRASPEQITDQTQLLARETEKSTCIARPRSLLLLAESSVQQQLTTL